MKLYYAKGTCSLAVRIVINELELPCEFESVNLKTKKTSSEQDFLQINPKGSVPVLLTDENEVLTENAVIQQYLADTYHATQLLPTTDNFKRYRILEWLNFISTELHKGCGPLFHPGIPIEMKNNLFKPALKAKLSYVEKNLQKKFLLGEEFTLADPYLFVILTWMPHFKITIAEWPQLTRYYNELTQRPSIKKSLQEEGLSHETDQQRIQTQ